MSQQSQQRKTRVLINEKTFDQVERLYKIKSKKELLDITNLSISALNNLIKKIESHEGEELSFSNIYKKSGRNTKDKSELYTEIRSIMGNDNSLNLKGCQKKLTRRVSLPQLLRDFKASRLTRKRIKKKASVLLTQSNMEQRLLFSSNISGKLSKEYLFLDESGFNLHTSNNYGYFPVAEDAALYQPASRDRNVSMCGIISNSGVEHYKLIDGGYNREIFATFLS